MVKLYYQIAKLQGESLQRVTVAVTQKDTQKNSLKILFSLHKQKNFTR